MKKIKNGLEMVKMKRSSFILLYVILFSLSMLVFVGGINYVFSSPLNNAYLNSTSVLFNISSSDAPNAAIIPNIDNSLVSWWRMDDLNATGGIVDYMGRNNGTTFGTAAQNASGKFGKSWTFNNYDSTIFSDYVLVPASTSTNLSNGTIAMWIYPYSVGGAIIMKGNSVVDYGFMLFQSYSGYSMRLCTKDACTLSGSSVLTLNAWNHVAIVANGTNYIFYENGKQDNIAAGGYFNLTSGGIGLGTSKRGSGGEGYNGSMDDVMIFNRSLSADEISSLYNATAYQHTENNLAQGAHTFNSYLQDFSGNINNTGSVNFVVDSILPTVSVDNPANNSYSNSATNNFSATASDSANNVSVFMNFDNSLVSWWRMDDLNATGGIADYMGRNNGTNVGATQVTNGKVGRAMSFDGNDYVNTSNALSPMTGNYTMAAWIKINEITSSSAIIAYGGAGSGTRQGIVLEKAGSAGRVRVKTNTSGEVVNQFKSLAANTWYQAVITRSGNVMSVYWNGVLHNYTIAGNVGDIINDGGGFKIGSYASGTDNFFNGTIDDVMIFNRSLSASEVASLYANSSTKYLNATIGGLADGVHSYQIYTQDSAGNVNQAGLSTINIDSVFPMYSFVAPVSGSYFNSTSVLFNISSSDAPNAAIIPNIDNSLVSWWRMDDFVGNNYYNQVNVTGTLSPDATGIYTAVGVYNGQPYYQRSSDNYFLWYDPADYYRLTTTLGTGTSDRWSNGVAGSRFGVSFSAGGTATGTALPSNVVASGNYLYIIQDYMNRNNGTAVNGATQVTNGKFGKAMSFDGSNDYLQLSSNPLPNNTQSFSFSAWVKRAGNPTASTYADVNGMYMIAYFGQTGYTTDPFRVGLFNNGGLVVRLVTQTASQAVNASNIVANANQWYLITVTYNGSANNLSLYSNGALILSNNSFGGNVKVTSNSVNRLGYVVSDNPNYFNGSIDDVMIWNRSLSSDEVLSFYNATAYQHTETLTAGNHTFNSYIQDFAGNVNNTGNSVFTVDIAAPSSVLLNPGNNTFTNNATQNFTVNISDNIGIRNAALNVYNQTGLFSQQSVTGFGDGKALQFDGADDYVDTNYRIGTNDISISAWFYMPTWYANKGIVGSWLSGGNYIDIRTWSTNGISVHFGYTTAEVETRTDTALSAGVWNHVVYVANRTGNTSLYINGIVQNDHDNISAYSSLNLNSTTFRIGRIGNYLAGYNFNGSIDEVQIWNRSLSQAEITQLYNSGAGLYANTSIAPFNSGLVAAWHFDNSTGENSTYFKDITGVNNGTCTGTTCPSYVAGKVLDPASVTFNANTLTATVGIVVSLIDGVYNWFYSLFDWAGNSYNTANNTLVIDTVYPQIDFDSSNPTNGTGSSSAFNITALINETNIDNVTLYFNNTNYVYYYNASNFNLTSGNQYLFWAQKGPLGPTEQIYYNLTITDRSGQRNSTATRLITGNQPPSLVSLTQSPADNAALDPLTEVFVNATLLDNQTNFESAWLQVTNNSSNWNNLIYNIPMTTNGSNNSVFVNASFVLPVYESNISYRIFTNDSIGGEANLSIYNISSFYDCTWEATTSLGGTAGYSEVKSLGYMIINNTGDYDYSDHCTLAFKSQHNLDSGKITLNGNSKYITYALTSGQTKNISVNYSFGIDIKSEPCIITTTETLLSNPSQRNTTGTAITNREGPYLYQLISSYPSILYIGPQIFNISAYISNLMGSDVYNESNSAFNVSSVWTFDGMFSNISGNTNYLFTNMSNDSQYGLDLELNTSWNTITQGVYVFSLNSYGFKNNGNYINDALNNTIFNNSVNISFLCNSVSDGFDAAGCWPTDPDTVYCGNGHVDTNETCSSCSADVGSCVSSESGSSSSGGGGGGGGGGSFAKSSATFELVRGQNNEFELVLDNKLDFSKSNIKIKVTGNNSQYVSVEPKVIDYLGAKSSSKIRVKITAPSYFTSGEFLLQFDFSGNIDGNSSTPFTEVKYVTLLILEMPRKDADKLVNDSQDVLAKMNSSGFYLKDVQDILNGMQNGYSNLQFNTLKDANKKINEIYTAATESVKLMKEINSSIIEAEKNGISVSETKKLLYLSQILFNRGDYLNAFAKLKEAKTSLLLETKGEFNLLYAVKNNPMESLGILISVSLVGLGSGYLIRLGLLKRKLRVLGEEEVLLLQLMRVVQRDCFDGNKISMEEYDEAMIQYENKLGSVIQEKIKTEAQIANINKLSGKKKSLVQEKDRLTVLVKQTQDDYMNRGKLDTRIYENMLRTYATRLSKIQEELAYMEAESELRKVGGFWSKLFGK